LSLLEALELLWPSFFSAFILNIVPFGAPPYVVIVAYEARHGLGLWPPVLSAALGAALAKMIMYYLGVGLRRPLSRNRNVRLLARYSTSGWVYLLAFIAAVIPVVPLDDFIYLAGGASGLRALAMAATAVAGKFVKTSSRDPGHNLRQRPLRRRPSRPSALRAPVLHGGRRYSRRLNLRA